jgi:hypothetical protein
MLQLPKNAKLAISFRGGRTSAVMTKLLLHERGHENTVVSFANTGCEHPKTLEFVHQCDQRLGFKTVWLEAVVSPEKGEGIRHKIVDFNTASRDGSPFRDYIAKYGIPNMGSPQCTARLKENVLHSYQRRALGWGNQYFTAIGIRADEADRQSVRAQESRFIYPLVELGYTKEQVIAEVRSWGFDLGIPEHYGNCVWCWKKSWRKLLTIAQEQPSFLDFPERMEAEFSQFKVTAATRSPDGRRLFFRRHKSVADLRHEAALGNFIPFNDKHHIEYDEALDFGVGCSSGCEIGSDERFGVDIDAEEP